MPGIENEPALGALLQNNKSGDDDLSPLLFALLDYVNSVTATS